VKSFIDDEKKFRRGPQIITRKDALNEFSKRKRRHGKMIAMTKKKQKSAANYNFYIVSAVVFALMTAALFVIPTQRDKTNIEIENIDYQSGSLVVRNTGAVVIDSLDVYVDNAKMGYLSTPLQSGEAGEIFLLNSFSSGRHDIKLVAGNYQNAITIDVPEAWVTDFQIIASR
jgi:hypothetical protein